MDEWKDFQKLDDVAKQKKLPEWLQKVRDGNKFNKERASFYPHNEIYLEKPVGLGGKGKYVILDSYNNVKGEIISRKFTQFDDIQETTGLQYIKELKSKYPVNAKIAQVDSNINGSNKALKDVKEIKGDLILEIPAQKSGKISYTILKYARDNDIKIRDINGKIYK
ncbi:hypothetical protein H8R25_12300 [Flavobacterium sp. F-392]|uniref:Uncharacterized protein n=1 Tax=Flavobacterium muglaense TaxID=2764716 RepID=A0A923SG13_9FLAO|nr:hypothetical protein [Flavobacterium muglaense]MBC5845216.1 hypothetical protein [Flavobacterium muglaense]